MSHEYEEMQVEKWVNLEDVAEHLSISQDTVRTWIKEGKLPVYRAGKRYKFKISEVDEWVREGKIQELDWILESRTVRTNATQGSFSNYEYYAQ